MRRWCARRCEHPSVQTDLWRMRWWLLWRGRCSRFGLAPVGGCFPSPAPLAARRQCFRCRWCGRRRSRCLVGPLPENRKRSTVAGSGWPDRAVGKRGGTPFPRLLRTGGRRHVLLTCWVGGGHPSALTTLPNARSLLRVVCRHRNDLSAQTVIDHASTFEGWNTTVGSALPNDRRAHTAIADAASKNRLVLVGGFGFHPFVLPKPLHWWASAVRGSAGRFRLHLVGRHCSSTCITSAPRGGGFTTSTSPAERWPLDAG